GVPGPLPRRDHHVAHAGTPCTVLRSQQLAEAPRGSSWFGVDVEARLVLERDHVPRLGRVRRRGVPVARPTNLRPADRVPAKDVVAPGGLEEIGFGIDLMPRGAIEAAMTRAELGPTQRAALESQARLLDGASPDWLGCRRRRPLRDHL